MKILLIGGFLGSGKTSFILKLAHHMIEDLGIANIVILENEIGEISVDDKVLGAAGYEVRGLFAGCVCCTLAGELPSSIRQIERELNPDWLIMEATGVDLPYVFAARRPGDAAVSYSDPSLAERELGWKAKYDLKRMCEDSWRWQKNNPNGYDA